MTLLKAIRASRDLIAPFSGLEQPLLERRAELLFWDGE